MIEEKKYTIWDKIYHMGILREDSDYISNLPFNEVKEILNSEYVVYRNEDLPPLVMKVLCNFGGHGLKLSGDFRAYCEDYKFMSDIFEGKPDDWISYAVEKVDDLRVATPLEVKNNKRSKGASHE